MSLAKASKLHFIWLSLWQVAAILHLYLLVQAHVMCGRAVKDPQAAYPVDAGHTVRQSDCLSAPACIPTHNRHIFNQAMLTEWQACLQHQLHHLLKSQEHRCGMAC